MTMRSKKDKSLSAKSPPPYAKYAELQILQMSTKQQEAIQPECALSHHILLINFSKIFGLST